MQNIFKTAISQTIAIFKNPTASISNEAVVALTLIRVFLTFYHEALTHSNLFVILAITLFTGVKMIADIVFILMCLQILWPNNK